MIHAATEAKFHADLMPLEGVESALVRLMARAAAMADACFDRAEAAQTDIRYDGSLRLAARLGALFTQTLAALHRHRAAIRQDLKAAVKQGQQAQFDQVLHLAALANAAQKAKGGVAPRGAVPGGATPARAATRLSAAPPDPPLNRQQRRAAASRLRKAGGVAQGP